MSSETQNSNMSNANNSKTGLGEKLIDNQSDDNEGITFTSYCTDVVNDIGKELLKCTPGRYYIYILLLACLEYFIYNFKILRF